MFMKVHGESSAVWSMNHTRDEEGDVLFGHAVCSDFSGDTILVGAPIQAWTSTNTNITLNGEDSHVPGVMAFDENHKLIGTNSGKAYVVHTHTGKIQNRMFAPLQNTPLFGQAVAMSKDGTQVAISAPSVEWGGTVHLYTNGKIDKVLKSPRVENYKQPRKFHKGMKTADVLFAYDRYGTSIAISDTHDMIAVGAPSSGDPEPNGAVYLFSTKRGSLVQTIVPPNDNPLEPMKSSYSYPSFGTSIAWNDQGQLLVGAPDQDLAWLFAPSGQEVLQTYRVPKRAGTAATATTLRFGQRVQMSANGDTVIISAPGNIAVPGRVYIYDARRSGSTSGGRIPLPTTILEARHPQPNDQFGSAIGLDEKGNVLVVGAPLEDNQDLNDGIAHVYQLSREEENGTGTNNMPTTTFRVELMDTFESRVPRRQGRFGSSVDVNGPGTKAIIGSEEGIVGVYCRHDTETFKWGPCIEHYNSGSFSFLNAMVLVFIIGLLYAFVYRTGKHKQYAKQLVRQYQRMSNKHHYYEDQSVEGGSYSNQELQLQSSVDYHNNTSNFS